MKSRCLFLGEIFVFFSPITDEEENDLWRIEAKKLNSIRIVIVEVLRLKVKILIS